MDTQIWTVAAEGISLATDAPMTWILTREVMSLAANIATAAGIIFGGWQLYVLNRAGKIEAHLNLIQSEREIWISALKAPEISGTIVPDVWGISGRNRAPGNLFVAILMDNCEHVYIRYKSGLLTKSAWKSFEGYIQRLSAVPVIRASWSDISTDYAPDFVAYIEKMMASTSSQATTNKQAAGMDQPQTGRVKSARPRKSVQPPPG